jgi:hypothetical protein
MTADDLARRIARASIGLDILSEAELEAVLQFVASAGFDPAARERLRGDLAGVTWRGVTLRGSDRLPPAERHYLKHVIKRQEWPIGTSLADYLASLRAVILDPMSGVFTSRYEGAAQLGILRESADLRGPSGHEWVLIDYRVTTGHWVTAYQPEGGLEDITGPPRTDLRWWREPKRSSA